MLNRVESDQDSEATPDSGYGVIPLHPSHADPDMRPDRESSQAAASVERPDPEVQAGRALRRLRLSRGWSQEEVARRMQAFGYEFHQTMVAKIEAAQRPLRVRELADFAALYGVEVQDLIHAPYGSLEDVAQEIAEVEAQWRRAQQRAEESAEGLRRAQQALSGAQRAHDDNLREASVLWDRLDFLRQETEVFDLLDTSIFRAAAKPDLSAVRTTAELVAALQELRAWAGNPSFRMMAGRAGDVGSAKVMAAAMSGRAPLTPRVMGAILQGCGASTEDGEAFFAAWKRVTPAGA
jgi:transcriptional regulator with XRE-family HTH domain